VVAVPPSVPITYAGRRGYTISLAKSLKSETRAETLDGPRDEGCWDVGMFGVRMGGCSDVRMSFGCGD
jgi:hypothetical protein